MTELNVAQDEKSEVKDWYFTFGFGQTYASKYHVVYGTKDEAREKMFERFGSKWAMQYDSAEAAGVDRYKLMEII